VAKAEPAKAGHRSRGLVSANLQGVRCGPNCVSATQGKGQAASREEAWQPLAACPRRPAARGFRRDIRAQTIPHDGRSAAAADQSGRACTSDTNVPSQYS
jgi:hypothetical protein